MKSILAALALLTMTTLAADTDGPVYHVVHFKFKAEATPDQIKKVETEFAALKDKVEGIQSFAWGTDSSKENLSDGFTHCWIVVFKDAKARDTYLEHPAHKAFVEILKPILDKPMVVDFVPKK